MIVDDDSALRRMRALMVGTAPNFEVSTAADASTALEHLRDNRVDIVLANVIIPVTGGMKVGAQVYLVKPVKREKLLIALCWTRSRSPAIGVTGEIGP
ncbi:MAG TPA: hypothetical protein DCR55_07355 [Lentisphaeria bacterium]|nr:hypothetical protein [Lentisphaeria bacterium]